MKNELRTTNSSEQRHDKNAASLEEVRQTLKSFGYLNRPIERFYLRSLTRSASVLLTRLVLSFRVGLLAGTVAALLLTAGTLLFNQQLFATKLDLILLFFYFEFFFVAVFSFLEFFLIYAVAVMLRMTSGRKLFLAGQAISFFIGLAFFLYFFYWGRSQYQYLQVVSRASIFAMLLILVVSCIFVAKSAWLGFLVAFRVSEVGRVSPNWRRYGFEISLSLAAILILLPFVAGTDQTPQEQPPAVVFPTSDRWLIVGVDGISYDVLQRFARGGALKHLAGMQQKSVIVPIATTEAPIPPVIWTTIATGVPSTQHGIRMPEVRRWAGLSSWVQVTPFQLAVHSIMAHGGLGQRQPVSGYLRRMKAFWEILSDHGIKVGVVNWWGSWPALPIRGWNISERYYYKLLAGERGEQETYPPQLYQIYAAGVKNNSRRITGQQLDQFYMKVFQQQMNADPARVAALYLPGLDILNYEFFEAKRMDPFQYAEVYRAHLMWVDETIGQLRSQYPHHDLMLVLHRGRSLTSGGSVALIQRSANRDNKLIASAVNEVDLAPVILYTCGVPVAKNMNTDLLQQLISPATLSQRPIHYVQSYAATNRLVDAEHADEFNDLLVEQMKSLGYLQ